MAPPGEVMIEGRGPIVTVYENIGGHTPEARAAAIEQRILALAQDSGAVTAPELRSRPGWTEIAIDGQAIMVVTDGDAEMAGQPREKLAAHYAENIAREIPAYRQDHSWRLILEGIFKTILATLILFVVLRLIRRTRYALKNRIEKYISACTHLEQRSTWQTAIAYVGPIALGLGAALRWAVILSLIQLYLTATLSFFSVTRAISLTVTKWLLSQLGSLLRAGIDYLPNLLVLAVILLVTRYLFQLFRLIGGEIRKGELKIAGFYPDWVDPTEKLLRVLVIVLALIVAFPYLPGAKSPAFQGISIFLGVLLSLGSSSAVASAIAGIILTYMRSYLVGDWVQIGDTIGEVREKNLLVTRVLTPKAEVITIPNALVMSSTVKNYSAEARKSGVIFFTTVTIGYETSWRTVYPLLTNAALATRNVLREPAPFVLQRVLNDFNVAYELNAFTDAPREMLNIYSELHQNIQDQFNRAGLEICSPHFTALRDGNATTLPAQYVKPDYKAPSFRVKAAGIAENEEPPLNPSDAFRQVG